jgi:hypothetical protein
LYAFDDDQMVGHLNAWQVQINAYGGKIATIFFPKTLPGYEDVREPLVEAMSKNLLAQGISRINMWGCSMWPGSFEWNEAHGFRESADRPRGYKIYMTYNLSNADLDVPDDWIHPVVSADDRSAAAQLAKVWYKRPVEECLGALQRMEPEAITHLLVRQDDRVTGACLVARNDVRPSLAAIYYIYVETAQELRQLIP